MENFDLWGCHYDHNEGKFSFLATRLHIQHIQHGTREMLVEMLGDLGIHEVDFTDWCVEHFLANYLTSNPDSPNWQDIWLDTWKITVSLPYPQNSIATDCTRTGTWAYDETWEGESSSIAGSFVVVDFYSEESTERAKKVLALLTEPSPPISIKTLLSDVELTRDLLNTWNKLLEYKPLISGITIQQRENPKWQLFVEISLFNSAFSYDLLFLLNYLVDLCRLLGGTTLWDEKAS